MTLEIDPQQECCSYRDHFGDPEICPCPEHPRDSLHVYGWPVNKEAVREAILRTIGTFQEGDAWVGGGADRAAADLIIDQVAWAVRHGIVDEVRRMASTVRNADPDDDPYNATLDRTLRLIKAEHIENVANHIESWESL